MHFSLTDETTQHRGRTLYRIVATESRGKVKEGDLGGFVESSSNLSQRGQCWVGGDAKVFDSATVTGDAQVYEDAGVCGNVIVEGSASVYGSARLWDHAIVGGRARVFGIADVFGSVIIRDSAQVYDRARVSERAAIQDSAKVYGSAYVTGNARVNGLVSVCGSALLSDGMQLSGDECISNNVEIVFIRSKYAVTITPKRITIGCKSYLPEQWESFTDEEISAMDSESHSLPWWRKHKSVIMQLHETVVSARSASV